MTEEALKQLETLDNGDHFSNMAMIRRSEGTRAEGLVIKIDEDETLGVNAYYISSLLSYILGRNPHSVWSGSARRLLKFQHATTTEKRTPPLRFSMSQMPNYYEVLMFALYHCYQRILSADCVKKPGDVKEHIAPYIEDNKLMFVDKRTFNSNMSYARDALASSGTR